MNDALLVRSFTGQWSPAVRRFLNSSQQCSSARRQRWKGPGMFTQSHSRFRCNIRRWSDYRSQDDKMVITQSRLTTQARRQHVSSSLSPSDALWCSVSDLWCFFFLRLQLHAFYTQPQIWKSLRHSSSLEHFPESSAMHSRNYSVIQVAFPFVRQTAHSTNTARFTSYGQYIRNFDSNVLTLPALHCIAHTQLCQSIPSWQ